MSEELSLSDEYCDTSFDGKLYGLEGINRLPWVGLHYKNQETKTLILGESVYDWSPKDPSSIEKIYDAQSLRKLHKSHALNFKRNSKFIRNIERAIYDKRRPSDAEKSSLWQSVVYQNLVSKVLKTNKHRPSYDDYYSGWQVFDKTTSIFDVDQVIVYGLESIKIRSFIEHCNKNTIEIIERLKLEDKIGRSHPRKIVIRKDNKNITLLFIRHPSSYFSWSKWAPVIRSEIIVPDVVVE